jgi:hypothetical protein
MGSAHSSGSAGSPSSAYHPGAGGPPAPAYGNI